MGEGDFIALRCATDALVALASSLTHFGPTEGAPDWLVSAVWLCCGDTHYLATSSAQVLPNGVMVRPLHIHSTGEFVEELEAEIPDVSTRLRARDASIDLPPIGVIPVPPPTLHEWSAKDYSTDVLVRVSERNAHVERVACGLIFEGDARSLLVGTDTAHMAMVFSSDAELIGAYCAACERLSVEEYVERLEA